MRINELTYCDTINDWNLMPTKFKKDLTLLVGVSGVGKTRILKAILSLRELINGKLPNGVKWSVNFTTIDGINYTWSGKTEVQSEHPSDFSSIFDIRLPMLNKNSTNTIKEEFLYKGSDLVFSRNQDEIFFQDKTMPKLSANESLISILKEEELIKTIYRDFSLILFEDLTKPIIGLSFISKEEATQEYETIEELRQKKQDIISKIYLTSQLFPEVFNDLKEQFIDIFPHVENIRIHLTSYTEENESSITYIQIKEQGVSKWINQGRISSGMIRTFIHLAQKKLCANGTIFLIDEFENSLGVNCLDQVTDELLDEDRQVQYIVTSHHPYIINNINHENWLVVTRAKNKVQTELAEKYIEANSKHNYFMQLMQNSNYITGITES